MNHARRPNITLHHSRFANKKEDATMDSYRIATIAMLETVTDAKLMRVTYEAVKFLKSNR